MSANSDKLMASIAESLEKMPNLVYMGKSVETLMNICKPMVGATSTSNGKGGFVPTPTKSNRSQFLRGDGTWHDVVTKEDADTVRVRSENGTSFTGYLLSDISSADVILNTAKKRIDAKLQHFINSDNIPHIALSLGSTASNGYLELINTCKFYSRIMTEDRNHNNVYLLPSLSDSKTTTLVATDTLPGLLANALPDLLVNSATKGINITGINDYGQLKLSYGNSWDIIFRHDGSNFYILKSDTRGGAWTTACPLTISNAGVCNINGNAATATNATNAQSANTVGGFADAYHLGTLGGNGNGNDSEYLLSCQHNVFSDDRFTIQITNRAHEARTHEVRVDYATKSASSDYSTSATYASYKAGTSNTIIAQNESSAVIGDVTIASDGVRKNNVTSIPLDQWYYRPVAIQSSAPNTAAVGSLWIKI